MLRRQTYAFVLFALVALNVFFLSACSTAYRRQLRDYQRHAPSDYLQRTLAWTGATTAPTATVTTNTTMLVKNDLAALRAAIPRPEEAMLRVAAEVLNLSTETLRPRLAALETTATSSSLDALDAQFAGRLAWDDLKIAVAARNPAIRAARDQWRATLNQYEQAAYLENLAGQYRAFTRYLDVQAGKQLNRQEAQTFYPYPSVIAWKGEMVRQMVRLAELDWQQAVREQVVTAGRAFYEYQYLVRAAATTCENIDLVKGLANIIEEGYRAGTASQPDVLKLQTALARLEKDLEDLDSMRRTQMAQLNALLGRRPDAPLGQPEDKDYAGAGREISLERLTDRTLQHKQEVLGQQARLDQNTAALRMGEVMNRPLASQGYSTFERGMMPEAGPALQSGGMPGANPGEGESAAGGGMGGEGSAAFAPIPDAATAESPAATPFGLTRKATANPLYAQAESYLAEIRQNLTAQRAQLEQVTAQSRAQARSMFEDLQVARRQVLLLDGTVLPQSRSIYETELNGYTAGQTSFLDLPDSERQLVATRLELEQAHRDLNKAWIGLAEVAGQLVK